MGFFDRFRRSASPADATPTPAPDPERAAGSDSGDTGKRYCLGRYTVRLPAHWAEAQVHARDGFVQLKSVMARNITFDLLAFPGGGEEKCDAYLASGLHAFDDGNAKVANVTWMGQSFRGIRIEASRKLSDHPGSFLEYFTTNYCGDAVCFCVGVHGPVSEQDGSPTESESEELRSMMFTVVFAALLQAGQPGTAPQTPGKAPAPAVSAPPSLIKLETYQAEFRRGLVDSVKGKLVDTFVPDDLPASFPSHVVIAVASKGASEPVLHATNGVGRVNQPNSLESEDNLNVELVTFAEGFSPTASRLLSYLGRLLHLHEEGESAWKGFDSIKLFEPILGFQHFVLRPGGHIQVGGKTITLLAVVPVTEAEYKQASNGHLRDWLEAKMADPRYRASFVARWSKAEK